MAVRFGLAYDFRNPARWQRPWPERYKVQRFGRAVKQRSVQLKSAHARVQAIEARRSRISLSATTIDWTQWRLIMVLYALIIVTVAMVQASDRVSNAIALFVVSGNQLCAPAGLRSPLERPRRRFRGSGSIARTLGQMIRAHWPRKPACGKGSRD